MTAAAGRKAINSLGFRLGLVIGLSLLPVGLMAVNQSSDLLAEAQARDEAALAGETLRAVRPTLAGIKRAQGAAEMLSALQPDASGCAALGRLGDGGSFRFAAIYGVDGGAVCRMGAAPDTFMGRPELAAMLTGAGTVLSVLRRADGRPDLVALHARHDAGGVVTGFAAVSLREAARVPLAAQQAEAAGFSLFVFDRAGEILTQTALPDTMAALLPAGRRLAELAEVDVATFTARTEAGAERTYSLVRLVEGEVFALGTWSVDRQGLVAMRALPPLLFPALMWVVSLIAAWIAAEFLVVRHIRHLRSAIRDFAGGNRVVRPLAVRAAPEEIRETAEAFGRMTDAILRDEAELEDMLREKEVLLREVHHRVKNNLQLIASIVNMQIRRTRSEEARTIMRALQERMVSLATIHNGLYQTADLSEIGVETLLPGIIEQVMRNAQVRGQAVTLERHLESAQLTLDQAVPLALLLTEALSNAMKYASTADGSAPRVAVSFRREASGDALLEVSNSASGGEASVIDLDSAGTGIGTQLLRGFAKQLNGEFLREFAGGMCHLRVWFALLPPRAEAA